MLVPNLPEYVSDIFWNNILKIQMSVQQNEITAVVFKFFIARIIFTLLHAVIFLQKRIKQEITGRWENQVQD